jgi:AcrR family transcriptional regulator
LPRGPHTLTRKQVEANQRQRILSAMIETAGELGYASAPVAEVIARAGVSRKAFYAHFPNREGCFFEASDSIAAAVIELVEGPYRAAKNAGQGAEAALQALLERAIANPRATRLVLLELPALGDEGAARLERLLAVLERLLHEFLGLPSEVPTPSALLRSILGGLKGVLYSRAWETGYYTNPDLIEDLVHWIATYRSAPKEITQPGPQTAPRPVSMGGRAPGTLATSLGPSGRRGLRGEPSSSHSFVVHSQRERILDAVTNLSAAKGYPAVTIADISEHASVGVEAFYEHFQDKEDAFLVAYHVGHFKSCGAVAAAAAKAPDWPSAVKAGVTALFDFLASEPAFARLALIDALVATPRTAALARRSFRDYGRLFTEGLQKSGVSVAPLTTEAITGGLCELCLTSLLHRRIEELPSLTVLATYVVLSPVLGAKAALRAANDPA